MIIKKPYAFIIRHFKAINLVISACLAFIAFVAGNLQETFVSLKVQKVYSYNAEYMISNNIFIFVVVGLILTGLVYYLLKEKKKPTRAYLGVLAYLIASTILIMYLKSVCNTLTDYSATDTQLSLARDACIMMKVVGAILFVILFIRGIGFNLGQFNFSKDIREMKIVEEDSAEFEVMIGKNNYKYARGFRRFIRECKYYFLENLVYFTMIACIAGVACIVYAGYYYKTYLDRAKQEAIMTVDGINYSVNGAYITAEDFNGNIVKEGKKFIIINLTVQNVTSEDIAINTNKISLQAGNLEFYPTLAYNGKFYDLGVPYANEQKLISGVDTNVTLTFEVPETTTTRNWTLRIQEAIDNSGLKVLVLYRKFKIKTVDIDSNDKEIRSSIGEEILTNTISHNMFKLKVNEYKIIDNFDIKYALCNMSLNCSTKSKLVSSTKTGTDTMLVLNFEGKMYDDAYFTKTFKTFNEVFKNYATIIYTDGAKTYEEPAELVTNEPINGYVFFKVKRRVKTARDIKIRFDFRNQKSYLMIN